MRLHMLTGNLKHQFSVSAKEKYRICFWGLDDEGNEIMDPTWPKEKIKAIKITKVEDYHG